MSKEELLGEIKRHIDYTNAMNEKSLRDLQIENLYNLFQQKENIIKEVREYIMSNLITEWDIKNDGYVSGSDLPVDAITPILDILDKDII